MFSRSIILIIFLSSCYEVTQGKAIATATNVENSENEITPVENVKNSTSTSKLLPDNIFGQGIIYAINVKNKISDIGTHIVNDIANSKFLNNNITNSNSVNNTGNSNSTTDEIIKNAIDTAKNINNRVSEISTTVWNNMNNSTYIKSIVPDHVINALPRWAWITLSITLVLMLCCLCCCPVFLGQVLSFPFICLYKLILIPFMIFSTLCKWMLLPVRSCLNFIGFSVIGPVAGSLAACIQSCCYGGYIPAGSCFSCLQSFTMR